MAGEDGCSRQGCPSELPVDGEKIPDGWCVARVEEYGKESVRTYYLYICPRCKLDCGPKQTALFEESPT